MFKPVVYWLLFDCLVATFQQIGREMVVYVKIPVGYIKVGFNL